jgi:hypothetical protein
MVVRKSFRIAFALLVKAHRITFAFRIRIALFALFSHFRTFSTFLVDILRLMHQKVVKSARKMHKICKKSAKMRIMRKSAKCEFDAKMESKFASHRIAQL